LETSDHASSHHVNAPAPTVYIKTLFNNMEAPDKELAESYLITAGEGEALAPMCTRNAEIARLHSRYDHEIFWTAMATLLAPPSIAAGATSAQPPTTNKNDNQGYKPLHPGNHPLAAKIIRQL
jgi:hypothetical protein